MHEKNLKDFPGIDVFVLFFLFARMPRLKAMAYLTFNQLAFNSVAVPPLATNVTLSEATYFLAKSTKSVLSKTLSKAVKTSNMYVLCKIQLFKETLQKPITCVSE